jgi:hypothetical protein
MCSRAAAYVRAWFMAAKVRLRQGALHRAFALTLALVGLSWHGGCLRTFAAVPRSRRRISRLEPDKPRDFPDWSGNARHVTWRGAAPRHQLGVGTAPPGVRAVGVAGKRTGSGLRRWLTGLRHAAGKRAGRRGRAGGRSRRARAGDRACAGGRSARAGGRARDNRARAGERTARCTCSRSGHCADPERARAGCRSGSAGRARRDRPRSPDEPRFGAGSRFAAGHGFSAALLHGAERAGPGRSACRSPGAPSRSGAHHLSGPRSAAALANRAERVAPDLAGAYLARWGPSRPAGHPSGRR